MVDVAGFAAEVRRVDDVVFVETEVVAVAHSELTIHDLALVSHRVSDLLAHVLNDDLFWVQP